MVSIIVPVYNTSEYLEKCIDSILNQSCKEFELIIIDDGSTDNCGEICDKYARIDSRIHVIHQENRGLICARQAGFRASSGEWIQFVDSDDWIAPEMVEKLMKIATETDSDIVTSGAILAAGESVVLKFDATKAGRYEGASLEKIKHKLLGQLGNTLFAILPYLWNKLWRREVLEESLFAVNPEITIGEDVAIGFPALLRAKRITVLNEAFYYYRQDNNSMIRGSKSAERELENAKILYHHLQRCFREVGYLELSETGVAALFLNQLFTRAYEKVNQMIGNDGCAPFLETVDKPIVIYGAGAFGIAVYNYLNARNKVKCWIDSKAEKLQKFGLPVVVLNKETIMPDDIVIIPVFEQTAAKQIYDLLRVYGVRNEQIVLFSLTKDKIQDLLYLAE